MNVTIVDYQSGNISSVINSFTEVAKGKVNLEVTSNINKIKSCDKIVLPGQGSFKSCVESLNRISGLVDTLKDFAITNKKPLLGICVGLQMFADIGYEEAETRGLGWISGKVSKIDNQNGKFKLPHIGWNEIEIQKESKIFKDIKNKSHMYFVHSYEFIPEDKSVISATTDYSSKIVCSVERDNLFGTQFHPEKSDKIGLKVIDNFFEIIMKIFPAIDIKDKKCVRLIKGDFEKKTEYETSPVDQASKYKDHGFKNLHIVDLDGALTGKTVNLDIIKEIVSKYDLKVEIGGGVRSINSIKQYIDAGVEKVILEVVLLKIKNF